MCNCFVHSCIYFVTFHVLRHGYVMVTYLPIRPYIHNYKNYAVLYNYACIFMPILLDNNNYYYELIIIMYFL